MPKGTDLSQIPAKVLSIRPNTQERSAVLELPDGKTTIRDRIHCCLDPSQPQPDTVDNILACDKTYLKLIPKPQECNGDEQQAIDSMLQKLKAKGQEVQMMADQSVTSCLETSRYQDFSQYFESISLGLEKKSQYQSQK